MFVLLATEAPRTLLDPPLAAVPFAQLARIKQLQALVNAPLALLDTQPLRQEVSPPHLVVSALLAILAVHHQHLTLVDVMHALLARTNHHLAQLHAPRALPATPPRLQARRLSRNATNVLLAIEAPRTLLVAILAAVQSAHLAHIKLLEIMIAHLALLDLLPRAQARLQRRLVTLALLAILALYQHLTLQVVLHVLLAHLAPLLLPHALPAPLDHIHLLAQLHAQPALLALQPKLLEKHQLEIAFVPLVIPE